MKKYNTERIRIRSFLILMTVVLSGIAGLVASPSFIVIQNPSVFSDRKRPAVEFDHRKHEKAGLKCTDCHHGEKAITMRKRNKNENTAPKKNCASCHGGSETELMRSYHKLCIDCHDKMNKRAVFCGTCHKR